MRQFHPEIFYIERSVLNHPRTLAILDCMRGIEVQTMDDYQNLGLAHLTANPRFKREKKALVLARKKGELVKAVQRDLFRHIPDEYYIVHSQGCPFDCQYCFLYDYLDHQIPTIFVNIEEILESTRKIIESNPDTKLIFHAGEFSDALAFDHLTDLSRPLVELFAHYRHAFVEFRTKSANVENLMGLHHNGQSIISWTFSPQRVVQLFEYGTASADERVAAARACQEAGYWIGLRFDPLVRYPGWECDYRDLIEKMGAQLNPGLIRDCQLGVFRYTPGLGRIIRERFPKSWLRLEESVPCGDGKSRYLKPLRIDMYRKTIGWLREFFPNLKIELCMESLEVEEALTDEMDFGSRTQGACHAEV
jgi:spore photoproduct lyase